MRARLQSIARRRLTAGLKLIAAIVLLASAPTAFGQWSGDDKYDAYGVLWAPWNPDDWTRRFHLGAVVGFNISAKFNMSGSFSVSGNDPGKGIYDDGYVHPDNTGDPDFTSNWGYNSASQYSSSANTMTFHSADTYTAAGRANVDAGPTPGIDLAYSVYLWNGRHLHIGWELGFDWMPITISDTSTLIGSVDETTYVYDTGTIVIPDAPYHGGSSGEGPLLPTGWKSKSTATTAATITGSRTLDLNLYLFRLGPIFNLDLGKAFSVTASVGPAFGIADGDYVFNERIITPDTTSRNKGQFGATDLVFGGYVNTTLIYHLPQSDGHADLFLSAQYMPLSSANFKGANREGKLNLSGQVSLSIGINWPF